MKIYVKAKMLMITVVLLGASLFSTWVTAKCNNDTSGNNPLAYKDRGNRCEGIHPQQVSAYDIELISAMADYREPTRGQPSHFRLRFCLPSRINDVYVKVREIEYNHYYWMTDPKIPLRSGCSNYFNWPTATVVDRLRGLELYDLGALVRLGKQKPNIKEKVAPVILYHGNYPKKVSGYVFTFKTHRDAKLKYSIRSKNRKIVLPEKQRYLRTKGKKPFQIKWDNIKVASGFYQLNIKGYFVNNNETVRQSVRFYHQAKIR